MTQTAQLIFRLHHNEKIKPQKHVNFKELSIVNKFHFICNLLLCHCHHMLATVFWFIYNITLKPKDNLGRDIEQLKLKNLEKLPNYDCLMQDHIDQFHRKIESLWHPENLKEKLHLFESNFKKLLTSHPASFGRVYCMTVKEQIPGITKEDLLVIKMFYYKYVRNSGSKLYDSVSIEKLSLRHIKMYYNICVKCMNHAICHKGPSTIENLSYALSVFDKYGRSDTLHEFDLEYLKSNEDFIELLQMLKPNVKYNLGNTPKIHQEPSFVTKLLIEHFVDNKQCHKDMSHSEIEYRGINNLMLLADIANRALRDNNNKLPLATILNIGKELGLIYIGLLDIISAVQKEKPLFLETNLASFLLEYNINLDEIRTCVEKFSATAHDATKHIDIPLFELFHENVLDI